MASLVTKAKEKLPGQDKGEKGSNSTSASSSSSKSPIGMSRGSVTERRIPPEPVQQAPSGDFSSHNTERPLQLHNLARANRRVKKLEWDNDLARGAESYAQTLAYSGVLQHSSIGSEGENLYMSSGDASFEDAVDSWLNEEKKYHGEHIGQGNLADWGYFSQCVWHSTTHLGMGKARSQSGHTYIVGRYAPKGNVEGQRPYQP